MNGSEWALIERRHRQWIDRNRMMKEHAKIHRSFTFMSKKKPMWEREIKSKSWGRFWNEKDCQSYYRKFASDHQKWLSLIEYTDLDSKLIRDEKSLAHLATKVIANQCGMTMFPINKLQRSVEARGLKLDETIVNNIIKKNELNNPFTLTAKSNEDLCEIDSSTSNKFLVSSLTTAIEPLIDLSKNEGIKRSFETLTNGTNEYPSNSKKTLSDNLIANTKLIPSTFTETQTQLSGTRNDNPFSRAASSSSFSDVATFSRNLGLDNQINLEAEQYENYEMA